MAYRDYPSATFSCLVPGCSGDVVVTDRKALGFYNKTRQRPGGYDICDFCETSIPSLKVECLNKVYCVGDSGCLGDGWIGLLEEHGYKTAKWYLMNGQRERPSIYPYCATCKGGIVYTAKCRNVGCRGDGNIYCTGDRKQALIFVGKKMGEEYWPPKNCTDCKEFIDAIVDQSVQCTCCFKPWVFSAGRQIMLVRNEPKDQFKIPEMCFICLSLSGDMRREVRRHVGAERRQREKKREFRESLRTPKGKAQIKSLRGESFLRAASRFFQAPDPQKVSSDVKVAALKRVREYGGESAIKELSDALNARDTDAGKIARALANPAITNSQATKLAQSLGKLAAGGQFPAGLMNRIHVDGAIGMSTGFAGINSSTPRIAQAAAYEIYAAATIADNPNFPVPFTKFDIESFHYRFQHNRYDSVSNKESYEADIITSNSTFIDFKHSMTGNPYVTKDNLMRIMDGLMRGEIERAIIVSSASLTVSSQSLIADVNRAITEHNVREGDNVPPIQTYVQEW